MWFFACTPPNPPVSEAAEAVQAAEILTEVTDRAVLHDLEANYGYALDSVLGGEGSLRPSTEWLSINNPVYATLSAGWRDAITSAIADVHTPMVIHNADAAAYPAGNVARAFDVGWLKTNKSYFELAGLVNRLDRRDFVGGCGEIRLLYRLAYQEVRPDGSHIGSRLPFLLNLVLRSPQQDCAAAARAWAVAPNADALMRGPLKKMKLDRIELNAQIVRWPSGLETEFGGQALYLLRIWRLEQGRLTVVPLENTPDVSRIAADLVLKAELVAWIGANRAAIDQGVYQLPAQFLATEALSYSTLGSNRLANKPFDALFHADPSGLPEGGEYLRSRNALIERLNNGSCMGCHQAGSTAGFHFLGEDDPAVSGVTNRIEVPVSPHFIAERERRKNYVATLANGGIPQTFRPHSLMHAQTDRSLNRPCLLSTEDVAGAWGCGEGQHCGLVASDPQVSVNFGQCLENIPKVAGATCRAGTVTDARPSDPGAAFNRDSWQDQFSSAQLYALPEDKSFAEDRLNCRPTVIGVPLGRTYRNCTNEERGLQPVIDGAADICAVVGGKKFDTCVAGDFHNCLDEIVSRGMVASCSEQASCREDYVCQMFPYALPGLPAAAGKQLADAGIGFCTPTYFLFQMRLDGHPNSQ